MGGPGDTDPSVSVIIPARNAESTLGAALAALAAQDTEEPFEVIVVDNGSSDATASVAEAARIGATVIRRAPGDGPGAARNEGAAHARGAWLAFTDADCVPTPGWIRECLRAAREADLVQGAVRPDPDAEVIPFAHTVSVERDSGLFETANLFVSRDWFERVGGFEDIRPTAAARPFGEDAWLGWRLVRAGARSRFAQDALVHHAVVPRAWSEYVWERRRLAYFPMLAARIPELRERFFARVFLTRRTAAFDGAVTAGVAALVLRSPVPLAGMAPYLRLVVRDTAGGVRHAPAVAAAGIASDALGLGALLWGSLRHRTILL